MSTKPREQPDVSPCICAPTEAGCFCIILHEYGVFFYLTYVINCAHKGGNKFDSITFSHSGRPDKKSRISAWRPLLPSSWLFRLVFTLLHWNSNIFLSLLYSSIHIDSDHHDSDGICWRMPCWGTVLRLRLRLHMRRWPQWWSRLRLLLHWIGNLLQGHRGIAKCMWNLSKSLWMPRQQFTQPSVLLTWPGDLRRSEGVKDHLWIMWMSSYVYWLNKGHSINSIYWQNPQIH